MKSFENPGKRTSPENEQSPGITRRDFLKAAVASVALAATAEGPLILDALPEKEKVQRNPSELFNRKISGFEALYGELHENQVLFVDGFGRPIDQPVDLPSGQEINDVWLDEERKKIHKRHPGIRFSLQKDIPRQLNVRIVLLGGRDSGDPKFHPETYLDLVHHFAKKPTIGAERESRLEYVRHHALEGVASMPEALRLEVARYIPGLAAQESNFDNSKESVVHAKGIFQFMPETWRGLGYQPSDILSLSKQVEAVGKQFEDIYQYFQQEKAKKMLILVREEYFGGDEVSFQRYFLAPMMINAYNAGQGRMMQVLGDVLEKFPTKESLEKKSGSSYSQGVGYDAFHFLTQHASGSDGKSGDNYERDAAEYFVRIVALTKLLEKR